MSRFIAEKWRREHVAHLLGQVHDAVCDDELGEPSDMQDVADQCREVMDLRKKLCGEERV